MIKSSHGITWIRYYLVVYILAIWGSMTNQPSQVYRCFICIDVFSISIVKNFIIPVDKINVWSYQKFIQVYLVRYKICTHFQVVFNKKLLFLIHTNVFWYLNIKHIFYNLRDIINKFLLRNCNITEGLVKNDIINLIGT